MKTLLIIGTDINNDKVMYSSNEITEHTYDIIKDLISSIMNYNKDDHNWSIGKTEDFNIETGQYVYIPKWFRKYCEYPDYVLETFNDFVPNNINKIISIKVK